MIAQLNGRVLEINSNTVILDVAGVGYEIYCSAACCQKLEVGSEAALIIYTDIKQESIRLFGFEDRLEKQTFLLLLRVKGVGAKTASEIVSNVNKRELLKLVSAGDLSRLQSIKGIGRKTAERIMVELKDKVGTFVLENQSERLRLEKVISEPFDQALQALTALGFSKHEAEQALKRTQQVVQSQALVDVGDLVREALRHV